MIVTHAQTATATRRIYLGGKSSLEAWIEPASDGTGWSFHVDEAVTGQRLSDADRRQWAIHILLELATELNVPPDDLATVPFEAIAALHTADPYASRRIPAPRRQSLDTGYMATSPRITRPSTDYIRRDDTDRRRHR